MLWNKTTLRNLLILILGLAGIGAFFYTFSNYHPHSISATHYPKETIIQKADSVVQSWQFKSDNYYPEITFRSSDDVIDSLQKKWGKKRFKEEIGQSEFVQKLPLFSWQVIQHEKQADQDQTRLTIGLNTNGEAVSFTASNNFITDNRPFNRYAVRTLFEDHITDYDRVIEDSLIAGLLNYQHLSSGRSRNMQRPSEDLSGPERRRLYVEKSVTDLAQFYIQKTIWSRFSLQQDSVKFMDESGYRFGRAWLSTADQATGLKVHLTVDVLPAGSVKSVSYSIEPEIKHAESPGIEILEGIALFVILIFGIWLLVIFYLRIKARAIDTGPAIIIAVLAGFLVPGVFLLELFSSIELNYSINGGAVIFQNLMGLAILGAISATGFFVITAVSDSITRQYWPAKLKTWDLVRQGFFLNKPVGWGIVHAVAIGGVLLGIYSAFVSLFPAAYFPSGKALISDSYFLPSLANLMSNIFLVLLIIAPVFLILGNQIKGRWDKKWIIPIFSAAVFGLIGVFPFGIEPDQMDRLLWIILGFLLGYFYLKYDFLTLVFGVFVFANFITTANGWLIEGSPDANTFYLFILVLITITAAGVYFIVSGRNRDELPEYLPAYIEDQAKEQRVKQELSIARTVQKTFLPSKIHRLPGIDIAGVCIPAQETGGDYYDMIALGEERTAIAIGDVSGKGIRAAFYMTFTKGVLHSLSALILSPVELLNQLNRLFNENATRGTFISMIYGIIEANKREFTFARAGHNPMLIVRENGQTEWMKPDGVGIGLVQNNQFVRFTKEAKVSLKEGDLILMYTDGITETLNPGNYFYGEERLERLVKGVRKASSEKIIEIITDDVNEFKGIAKQHDDMTLVIIKADASVSQ